MTHSFIRVVNPPRQKQGANAPRTVVCLPALLCALVVGLWLFLPALAHASAEAERERLQAAWPVAQPPFDEWSAPQTLLRDGRLEFSLEHKTSGERALLFVSGRGEGAAYARTERYTLSYAKPPGSPEGVISPELERLLAAWAAWVDAVEGEESFLADAESVERLRRERLERQEAERQEAEAAQRREREALEGRTQKARTKQAEAPPFATRLVYGPDGSSHAFRFNLLPLYLGLLLSLVFLTLLSRINAMNEAFHEGDETWFRGLGIWLLPPAALVYGLSVAASLDAGVRAGLAPYPVGEKLGLVLHPLFELCRSLGLETGLVALATAAGLILAAVAVLTIMAYGLFWNRDVATHAGGLYFFVHLLGVRGGDPFSSLILDIALGAAFFGMLQQAWRIKNSLRLLISLPAFTLAIFLKPAFAVLLVAYFAYLFLVSQDRQQTLRYPLTWIVPLWVAVFSLPGLLHHPPPAAVYPWAAGASVWLEVMGISPGFGALALGLVSALWLLVGVGLLFHPRPLRRMTLALGLCWLVLLLVTVGLAGNDTAPLATESFVFPVLLAAVGLRALLGRRLQAEPDEAL